MKTRVIFILLFSGLLLLLGYGEIFAQSPPASNMESMSDGLPPPPVGLPIDFGISALIAAGIGLGVFHLKNKNKN